MEYVSRVPAPPLDGLIDDIYCLSGAPRHPRLNVPPMPSAHLFINMGGPVRLYGADPAGTPVVFHDGWFMGMRTRRFVIEFPSPAWVVGVHFKPWGLSSFIDLPSTELRDRCVPINDVWAGSVDRIRGRIAAARAVGGGLRELEDELRSRLVATPARGFRLVAGAARRVEAAWGDLSIGGLTEEAGVSANHLATQFKLYTGLAPKRVARIYRFARLILSVDARRPVDWPELAAAAGYYDQAHFSNEFKEFTGLTPTAYVDLRRRHPADKDFPPDNGPMPAE